MANPIIKKFCLLSACTFSLLTVVNAQDKQAIWKFSGLDKIGNYIPAILGKPVVIKSGKLTGLAFNGVDDGLIISTIPIESWKQFTIEVLFKPDGDGPKAPRFIHFEDADKNRGTLEIRLTPDKQWYLDAFLKEGKTNKGITLIDSAQVHPADKWYWVAMVYDGKKMYSYVNGIKQLESPMDFPATGDGQIAIGVRLNKVNWFKGSISEARFYPEALPVKLLQSIANN